MTSTKSNLSERSQREVFINQICHPEHNRPEQVGLLTQEGRVDDADSDGEAGVAAEDVVHVDQDERAHRHHQKDGQDHELGHDPRQHEPVGTLQSRHIETEGLSKNLETIDILFVFKSTQSKGVS